MLTRIRKWGNSLAVRIPSSFAGEAQLEADGLVSLTLVEGTLVLAPVAEDRVSLEDLLERVTPENLHGEIATGAAVGVETW